MTSADDDVTLRSPRLPEDIEGEKSAPFYLKDESVKKDASEETNGVREEETSEEKDQKQDDEEKTNEDKDSEQPAEANGNGEVEQQDEGEATTATEKKDNSGLNPKAVPYEPSFGKPSPETAWGNTYKNGKQPLQPQFSGHPRNSAYIQRSGYMNAYPQYGKGYRGGMPMSRQPRGFEYMEGAQAYGGRFSQGMRAHVPPNSSYAHPHHHHHHHHHQMYQQPQQPYSNQYPQQTTHQHKAVFQSEGAPPGSVKANEERLFATLTQHGLGSLLKIFILHNIHSPEQLAKCNVVKIRQMVHSTENQERVMAVVSLLKNSEDDRQPRATGSPPPPSPGGSGWGFGRQESGN